MSESAVLYRDMIIDRARAPRHAGRPPAFTADAAGDNTTCGDHTHVYVTIEDGAVADVAHVSRGCAIMAASADLMAQAVAGLPRAHVARRGAAFATLVTTGARNPALGDLNAFADVSEYRSRIRCALLPWSALGDALTEPANG